MDRFFFRPINTMDGFGFACGISVKSDHAEEKITVDSRSFDVKIKYIHFPNCEPPMPVTRSIHGL